MHADLYPKVFADKCRADELRVMQTGIPLIDSVEQAINSKGEVITFSTCKYPLYDQNGKIVGTWGISRDITKLVQAQEAVAQVNAKLMALSLLDDLSGFINQNSLIRMQEDEQMKINASVEKKDSMIRPGYMYINTYQPSALLSDTLLLDTLFNETEDTIYFKDTESKFILNNRKHLSGITQFAG